MANLVSPSTTKPLSKSGAIVIEETAPALDFFLVAEYDDGYAELVYDTAFGASDRFDVATSAISGGLEVTVTRRGGWRLPPTLTLGEVQYDGSVVETSWRWELQDARL